MLLPDIVVEVINGTSEDKKIELISKLIPNYIPLEISKENESRFRIHILGWTGTCSYVSTMSDPDKFVCWLKKKYKNISDLISLQQPLIANKLNEIKMTEKDISKIFKGKLRVFKLFVKDNQSVTEGINGELIKSILVKPSIFDWDTGTLKINKLGIQQI